MQSVPREWLDFLRQQFPKDSRIQLTEIGGNPRPISPIIVFATSYYSIFCEL